MNNLIVYKEAIKFYNGGGGGTKGMKGVDLPVFTPLKTKGMKGVDLPVFTPLKAVKNPGMSYKTIGNHKVDQNC